MLAINMDRKSDVSVREIFPPVIQGKPDYELDILLAELSPGIPWGERKNAARRIGATRNSEALPVLLAVLPEDPFWMVRYEIIQALERIADPAAVPTLRKVAKSDGFRVVREYAARAVERLS